MFDKLWEQIAVANTGQLVAKEVMPVRVQRLAGVRPTDVPFEVVSRFKGRAARVLGQVFPWPARTRVL